MNFKLKSDYKPAGGQPKAIDELIKNYDSSKMQTLLGITGSGKTFVMANLIEKVQRPTLVLAHNKTLAAQLYSELKELFPENRVEYFISYYDYYQPESYIPTSDTYIEKEATINEEIEKMRLSTTASLLAREDVIVVSSISCIYGLSNPKDFLDMSMSIKEGKKISREKIIRKLIDMQYERTTSIVTEGNFRVTGDSIDILPPYNKRIIRIELFGDEIESITERDHLTGEIISKIDKLKIFPAKQFVVPEEKLKIAINDIKEELEKHLPTLPPLEQERLDRKVKYDIEMLEEMGYCTGIENYSRYFDRRNVGEPPFVLLDYFPKDFLLIIDESHQTLPQARAMHAGDYSRKKNLVDFGFRLPSAFDNRPLRFDEFENYFNHVLFVSATPSDYELQNSDNVTDLIIRPTGLLDPIVDIKPAKGQIKDLLKEVNENTQRGYRTLITTLTKRQAEDLTDFLSKEDIKVRYMHSDIDSLDRIELIRQLREGKFDVLVGINLLREGLDIPEVALVAILDGDREGFLRDERSFLQTIGRAARNSEGRVIIYADRITKSIDKAVKITRNRRKLQEIFNRENNITPKTIIKSVNKKVREIKGTKHMSQGDVQKQIIELEAEMKRSAENLEFERAIEIRDRIKDLSNTIK